MFWSSFGMTKWAEQALKAPKASSAIDLNILSDSSHVTVPEQREVPEQRQRVKDLQITAFMYSTARSPLYRNASNTISYPWKSGAQIP